MGVPDLYLYVQLFRQVPFTLEGYCASKSCTTAFAISSTGFRAPTVKEQITLLTDISQNRLRKGIHCMPILISRIQGPDDMCIIALTECLPAIVTSLYICKVQHE